MLIRLVDQILKKVLRVYLCATYSFVSTIIWGRYLAIWLHAWVSTNVVPDFKRDDRHKPAHITRGVRGVRSKPPSVRDILSFTRGLTCGQIHWMVRIEDLISVSMIIPLVSFHYWHVIFTGECNSSTIELSVANPRVHDSNPPPWKSGCVPDHRPISALQLL